MNTSCKYDSTRNQSQATSSTNNIDLAGKVFTVGPFIDSSAGVISAECDCCQSDLFFKHDSTFFLVAYCLEGDTHSKGKYSVHKNKLTLFYDSLHVTELHDLGDGDSTQSATSNKQYEITFEKYNVVAADISFLKNQLVIKATAGDASEYALESRDLSAAKFQNNIESDSAWIKLWGR